MSHKKIIFSFKTIIQSILSKIKRFVIEIQKFQISGFFSDLDLKIWLYRAKIKKSGVMSKLSILLMDPKINKKAPPNILRNCKKISGIFLGLNLQQLSDFNFEMQWNAWMQWKAMKFPHKSSLKLWISVLHKIQNILLILFYLGFLFD